MGRKQPPRAASSAARAATVRLVGFFDDGQAFVEQVLCSRFEMRETPHQLTLEHCHLAAQSPGLGQVLAHKCSQQSEVDVLSHTRILPCATEGRKASTQWSARLR